MKIPFDLHSERVNENGYHNHRVNTHSDIISDGIVIDLRAKSTIIREDLDKGIVHYWKNQKNPWGRNRDTDLIIGEPIKKGGKLIVNNNKVRILIEHKSVLTAHRNRDARHDDLNNLYQEASNDKKVIVGATVMIGMCSRYLNVADQIKKRYTSNNINEKGKVIKVFDEAKFNEDVLSRIQRHDEKMWNDFNYAVSLNTSVDIEATIDKFRTLPVRNFNDITQAGFDALLLIPVDYDNVNPAKVARQNPFSINVDSDYNQFIHIIAMAYEQRFMKKIELEI